MPKKFVFERFLFCARLSFALRFQLNIKLQRGKQAAAMEKNVMLKKIAGGKKRRNIIIELTLYTMG